MATTANWGLHKPAQSDHPNQSVADLGTDMDVIDSKLATGQPRSGMSNITACRLLGMLNHTGPPVGADGTFAVADVVWDSTGLQYVCTVAGSPGTWVCPSRAGAAIASASSTALTSSITSADMDLSENVQVSFDSPADRDLWVVASFPTVGAVTASAITTVKITDGAGTAKTADTERSGTASRNHVNIRLAEIIPAGSGTGLVRKLRANSGSNDGYVNSGAGGKVTLDVFVR